MGNACIQSKNTFVSASTICLEQETPKINLPNKQQLVTKYIYQLEENLDDFSEPFYALQFNDLDDKVKQQDNEGLIQISTLQTYDNFLAHGFQTLGEQSFSQDTFQQMHKTNNEEDSEQTNLNYKNKTQNNIQLKKQNIQQVQRILQNEFCKSNQQSSNSSSSFLTSTYHQKKKISFQTIKSSQFKYC